MSATLLYLRPTPVHTRQSAIRDPLRPVPPETIRQQGGSESDVLPRQALDPPVSECHLSPRASSSLTLPISARFQSTASEPGARSSECWPCGGRNRNCNARIAFSSVDTLLFWIGGGDNHVAGSGRSELHLTERPGARTSCGRN